MTRPRTPIPKNVRLLVKAKYNFHCAYCGIESDKLHCDHIKSVARGGTNDLDNLLPACPRCNNLKHTFSIEQFRNEIAQQIQRARQYSVNFRTAERFGLLQVNEKRIVFYFEHEWLTKGKI